MEQPIGRLTPKITQEIKNRLAEVELKRLKMIKTVKITWLVFGGIALILFLIIYFTQNSSLHIPFGIFAFVVLLISITITFFNRSEVIKEFKLNVLKPTINENGNILYEHNNHITRSEFELSEIYSGKSVSRFKGEDLFFGIRGNTPYKFSEIHAEERKTTTDANGKSKDSYTTIFKGIFMMADFNKHLTTTTRVIRGGDGFFEKLFAGKSKVSLENPVFEKMYNTYSDDQVEARYILSPAMMERMLQLQNIFDTKVNFSFKGNHIFIAISSTKNHFEISLGSEIGEKQMESIYNEIEGCLKIIDVLDLNTRIWTKK